MMMDFKEYARQLEEQLDTGIINFNDIFVRFLADNEWFGIEPVWQDNILMVDTEDFVPYMERINLFFYNYGLSISEKNELLLSMLKERFPDTTVKLVRFFNEYDFTDTIRYYLLNFLLKFLKKELCTMNDSEVQELLTAAYNKLIKQYGDILASFLRWMKDKYRTKYLNDYFMTKRRDNSDSNEAYGTEEYLELLYYLFNEEYIYENEMYIKASESKNYIDTWLFLSLHFICALRNTDIVRIYHPRLPMEAKDVLVKVKDGSFSDEDARMTLYSITWRMAVLPLTPNKTAKHSGISSVKFHVPETVEVHIGTLLAIAEAHRLIAGIPDEEPLIRCISDYSRISRYMGDEIGALFLTSNFRTRSANKSYLQSVYMMTDDILENDDEFNVKGYILAALARSHKGSYGEFASTTAVYLKDAKLSGFTPEFVARELFERGVLSFIPAMLLKMITYGEYNKLPVRKQTELIQELNFSPKEVEDVVALSNKARKQSVKLVNQILKDEENTKKNILNILHRIGNGNAVSKQEECLCLVSAMKKFCPYAERSSCIGCEYEISTKSTMFLMISEYNRLVSLYQSATDEKIRNKYKSLIKETVLPVMDEMLQCIKEQYGEKAMLSLEKIIKENSND